MKLSEQPTNQIIVRADCNSEWDNCDFAVITLREGWAEEIGKRLEIARALHENPNFFSTRYFDSSASFYRINYEETGDVLPGNKDWSFVELDDGEEDRFLEPESALELYTLTLYKDGCGRYKASGSHTGENFYTEKLPLSEIIESVGNTTTLGLNT